MSQLGEFLKEKREEQGISLEKMQEMTKIQKRYLKAIEEGDHSALPGSFYARAFVKSYAEALRLDPDEVFEEYGSELPKPKQEPAEIPPRMERRKPPVNRKKSNKLSFLPAVMVFVFATVIAVGIWVVVQGFGGNDTTEGEPPADDPGFEVDSNEEAIGPAEEEENGNDEEENGEEEAAEEEAENGNEEAVNDEEEEENGTEEEENGEETGEIEHVDTESYRSTYTLTGTDELLVEMEFSGNSYVDIRDEDGDITETIHSSSDGDSESYDFSGQSAVTVNVGNTSAVTLYINGEEIDYPINEARQHIIVEIGEENDDEEE
ncbi:helix-turn-helix domain-containing protein [Bacillus sp. FJAT-44742]|uniref:helix-turn-helix domain-containing protein n=1 Tax=Bacillus sp. FJAT-44742 TaxID=2014005 RepID=UPI0018E20B52|nr:helix-turn-helix domain-containing protein [Bacillus sp. FJAT-44742]